jgi:SulP family sulfate permease
LAGILVASVLVIGLNLDTRTVGDMASIKGGLPSFHLPDVPLTLETLWIILPYSLIFAAVGLIESLLTLSLVSEKTETHGRTSKECIGQGASNIVTGFISGMGGCAMIGQSMINITSGGRGRLSGAAAALFLLGFILFGSSLIEMIPLAALVGVMFMVVIGTFAWASIRMLPKIPRSDAFVIILVSGVTVAEDLAVAVVVGVIASALMFAWQHAKQIDITARTENDGRKVYTLNGPLFFASANNFKDRFNPRMDPDDVVIDFQNSRVVDHSALEAIDAVADKYERLGKRLHLVHLSPDCRKLLHKAGDLVEVNSIEDPKYTIAVDYPDMEEFDGHHKRYDTPT